MFLASTLAVRYRETYLSAGVAAITTAAPSGLPRAGVPPSVAMLAQSAMELPAMFVSPQGREQ
ncbi:hypothetical protein H6F56_06325 [Microcoleus sp. FACHB-672]|nr:hypothetical protein [Microcoleus sp. FACHB-672]